MQRAGIKDILSGLIFVGLGAAFGYAAIGYPIGTAFRMGPGYFPLVLAGALHRAPYWAFAPAASISGFQSAIWSASILASASGVASSAVAGAVPSSAKRSPTVGSATAAFRASLSLASTSSGVPAGA